MNGPEERDQITNQSSEVREQEMQFEFEDAQMQQFERALSRAMQRVEVRTETTAKLLALADEAERKHEHASGSFRLLKFSNSGRVFAMKPGAWMGGAIAAMLAMGCFVGAHIHEQHERRIEAQRQFQTAERITDQALERTREQLQRQGIELDQ